MSHDFQTRSILRRWAVDADQPAESPAPGTFGLINAVEDEPFISLVIRRRWIGDSTEREKVLLARLGLWPFDPDDGGAG